MAAQVYRPDIYTTAAKSLIEEELANAKGFPNFESETGFKPPQTEFIDGITYDGTKPNEYLEKFSIGLKADDKV